MSTYHERRMDMLAKRIKGRTRHDGSPMPGFEQNVASLRAEMELISERLARVAELMNGELDDGE